MNKEFFCFLQRENNIIFNDKQKSAIVHEEGPLLVLASPGSGKTTVLNARIAYLIFEHKVSPQNILALTFSKASAYDMNDRFHNIYRNLINEDVKFSTIHSFAFKIVRYYYQRNKINYDLIEGKKVQNDKRQILKTINHRINKKNINDDKLEELVNAIGFVKNMMITPDDFKNHDFQIKNFEDIFLAYEGYKKNNEFNRVLLDFDDMLVESYNILQKNKEILQKCQKQYKYVLMDEGQDTSLIQNKIIEIIAKPENNLFIVCDDDQSIFGFRGADPRYLLEFEERFSKAKKVFMEQNYRSTKDIVEVSNNFIKGNKGRYPKDMFTENKGEYSMNIARVEDEKKQTEYIINELKKTKDLKETAILYRNNMSSIAIIDKLYKHDIAFYMKDYHRNFFNHWVLKDILNFIRFANEDSNVYLLESIYTKFKSYISKTELEYLKDQSNDKSVFDNLINKPDIHEFKKRSIKKFKGMFRELRTKNPEQAIKYIRNKMEYEDKLRGYCEIAGYSFESLKSILMVLEEISKDTFNFNEFVDKLNTLKKVMYKSRDNKNENAVTLSTLHSSKGLEFEKVFMVDLIDGQIPSLESIKHMDIGNMKYLEEERRLWYVGMTRAKTSLNIISMKYKSGDPIAPSRFIGEVEKNRSPKDIEKYIKNENYNIDSIVRHEKFGLGIVKDISKDVITIDFDNKGQKNLSMILCISNNLLEKVAYQE